MQHASDSVQIRPLAKAELGLVENFQRDVWRYEDLQIRSKDHLTTVEAPYEISAVKRNDVGLAREWQVHFRIAFPLLFENGYTVTGFVKGDEIPKRSFYLLTRDFKI